MLDKAYDPAKTEDRIYKMWEESGVFKADNQSDKEPFTISLPPPNATGQLHLGHAVMLALEDIFTRFARMQGKEALWLPGTDHAAIATENVVIKKLKKEGMADPRKELGREKLISEIASFVEESQGTIRSQMRKMGSSCDWSRERYTLDPMLNRCVNEVFKSMYDDGLIYRGHRIVNWDPNLQTTVSDDEIDWQEQQAKFYTFKYGPFDISTARPETKFGDKYVVMHPDDERYSQYKHGDTFECEWINGPVRATVIKDEAVDPEFGTGVMTITPWHDATDFEIAERHGLEKEQVIDFDGKLMEGTGEFAGMHIDEAREKIVEKLEKKGLLVKVDEHYVHRKAFNSRGGGAIEPQIKLQWFIDVNKPAVRWRGSVMTLKEVMHDVVHHGTIEIIPEHFRKMYFHWIDNLRDWCISRQIWWGHRVPVWYREEEVYAGVLPPEGSGWQQDEDTLDTWFSSALWTWSTLIDPSLADDHSLTLKDLFQKSPDFRKFHPTSVMETGYDIIFFWVARMILMTTYTLSKAGVGEGEEDRVPFKTVYLHGLIRTRDGKKMSKSDPETMIDPLDIIPQYGADALRLSMIVGQSPGNDMRLYEEKIAGYRNFINKLWNASRFVLMQCEQAKLKPGEIPNFQASGFQLSELSLADRALLHALEFLKEDVKQGLTEYRLSETGERLYSFVWDYFCDWYLELSKGPSSGSGPAQANIPVLVHALRTILTLLHAYCPFVTEEIWSKVKPEDAGLLAEESWPEAGKQYIDQNAFDQLQVVIDVITAVRRLRTEQNVEAGKPVSVIIHTSVHAELLRSQEEHIKRMGRISEMTIEAADSLKPEKAASAILADIEMYLPLEGLADIEKEKESLEAEKANLEKYLKGVETKLNNKQFVDKAPAAVVEGEKAKAEEARGKLKKVEERLQSL